MKILHLTLDYRPSIGGIATHIENLNRFLRALGVDSRVLHIVENSGRNFLEDSGDGVLKLHIRGNLRDLNKFPNIGRIRKTIDALSPDVLHVHSFNAIEYAAFRWKYPWVWTAHFSSLKEFSESRSLKSRLLRFILKWIYDDACAIIAVSKFMKEVVSRITRNQNIFVIPSGIDPQRFYPTEDKEGAKRQLSLPPDRKIIFFPSRWVPFKGLHILLEAVDILRKKAPFIYERSLFILTGKSTASPDYVKQMESRIRKHSNIITIDAIPYEDMPLYYRASDIVVIPSLYEPLGIVVLEAMSSGVPVIASRTGGITDIVEDGKNGILFEQGNPYELAEGLLRVLEDEELAQKLSEGGIKTAQRFSWKRIASKVKGVYESVAR